MNPELAKAALESLIRIKDCLTDRAWAVCSEDYERVYAALAHAGQPAPSLLDAQAKWEAVERAVSNYCSHEGDADSNNECPECNLVVQEVLDNLAALSHSPNTVSQQLSAPFDVHAANCFRCWNARRGKNGYTPCEEGKFLREHDQEAKANERGQTAGQPPLPLDEWWDLTEFQYKEIKRLASHPDNGETVAEYVDTIVKAERKRLASHAPSVDTGEVKRLREARREALEEFLALVDASGLTGAVKNEMHYYAKRVLASAAPTEKQP